MPVWKSLAKAVFDFAGGVSLARFLNRGGLRVLVYHRFMLPKQDPAGALERQCAHLRKHYQPLALKEVAARLRDHRGFPPNALAVTVDDGYWDFYTTAFPVFSACGIPVTVFLPTDFLDGKIWMWWDQVEYAVKHTRLRTVGLALAGDAPKQFPLETEAEREQALSTILTRATQMANQERMKLLADLPETCKVSLPSAPPAEYRPMSWDEVRQLAKEKVEFGGHSKSHPILSRLSREEDLREEIEGCKRRIEEELGEPVLHFCYPNGKLEDISARAIELVKKAGYAIGVTTEVGLNRAGADPFLLKRVGAEPELPEAYFRRCVAGFSRG